MPGITHWQSPRYFAYFATTAAEPGILAELLIAALNQVGILWRASPALQELEEVTLDWLRQLLGLPERLHGHIEDTASSGLITALAAARAAAPGQESRRLLRAHALVDREGSTAARARAAADSRPTPPSGCGRTCSTSMGPAPWWQPSGRRRRRRSTPSRRIADRSAPTGAWLHVDAAYAGSAAVCPELRHHFAGWERADSIGVNPHKWLFTPMDCSVFFCRRPDDLRRGLQPRARVPARRRGRRQPQRVRLASRPPIPSARSSGRRCAASVARACRRFCVSTSAWPRSSRSGSAASRGGSCARRGPSRSCASGRTAATRRTRRSCAASTTAARSSSPTRSSTAASCLRLAIGNVRTTEADVAARLGRPAPRGGALA